MAVGDSSPAAAGGGHALVRSSRRGSPRGPRLSAWARLRSERRPRAPIITPMLILIMRLRRLRPAAASLSALLLRRVGGVTATRCADSGLCLVMEPSEGMFIRGEVVMPRDVFTRRAALLSFGAFAAAGLSGCNTTPTAGVQPVAAPSGLRIGAINVDTAPLVAYVGNPTAGWAQQALPGALAQVLGSGAPGRAPASSAHRHSLSGQRRAGRSRPHKRRRDVGRQDDQGASDLDIFFQSYRSGPAGAGAARPGAGARGGLRLPAKTEAEGVTALRSARRRLTARHNPG